MPWVEKNAALPAIGDGVVTCHACGGTQTLVCFSIAQLEFKRKIFIQKWKICFPFLEARNL
jgi:hypothetical protein